MRVIIAGSRDCAISVEELSSIISESGFDIKVVISGTARGTDKLGERWAADNNIPIEKHSAEWDYFGMSAGYIRNEAMAKDADALIALSPTPTTRGTQHMINLAKKNNLKIHIKQYNQQ